MSKPHRSRTASEDIAEKLRQRIADGTYPLGTPLPSSQLRAEFGVADGTVRRALAKLGQLGLITSRQGAPATVSAPGEDIGTQHERVLAGVRAAIADGRLRPGGPFPSEAELAADYEVGRGTVRIAVAELEKTGEVLTRAGRRRQVAGGQPEPDTLYAKIAANIRREIAEGRFPAESVLPTEAILVAEHHASRLTVRRALDELADAGIIDRGPNGTRIVRGG